MGLDTEELYIQGFSSSMPEEVQIEMLHSVKGLEHAEIMRPAYAIEYDCIDPTALYPTLEYKHISGLYGAGQFNGSSGYEEAAVQGFVAGVNAARKLKGETPFILGREQAYIGTLIDDLVTKGTNEPYRMMTSRSEYRLILRQDNADERLAPIGHELGLVSDETLQKVVGKYDAVRREIKRLEHTGVPSSDALNALSELRAARRRCATAARSSRCCAARSSPMTTCAILMRAAAPSRPRSPRAWRSPSNTRATSAARWRRSRSLRAWSAAPFPRTSITRKSTVSVWRRAKSSPPFVRRIWGRRGGFRASVRRMLQL